MQTDLLPPATGAAPIVLAPDEGRATWVGGFLHTVKVDAEQTGGAFSLVEAVVPAGGGPPPHRHTGEAEAFVVLEGAFEFFCDGRTFTAGPGAFVYLPTGTVHTWRSLGPADGRVLVVIAPGGFERYFDDVGVPAVAGEPAPPFTEADAARMLATGPAYGLSFHLDEAL